MASKEDAKYETKTIKLDLHSRSGKKKFEKLIADGWETVRQHDKGILEWGYKTDLVLRRPKA